MRGDRLLGIVYLSRTPNNILRHMYATRDRFILAGLTILGLTLLLGWVTTRTLVRPINRLAAQAAELGRGNRQALTPLDHYGTYELAALGRSFLDMARALDGRSQYIRDFAAHVSHELKGPLSAIRGSAELLQEHLAGMSEADRARFLGNIVADTDRLRLLVSRLIELAHAENVPRAEVAIDIAAAVDRLALRHGGNGLAIVRTGAERLETCISAESFEIVATNLIQNSKQAEATAIEVSLEATEAAGRIVFKDNGPGIAEGNRGRIFEPFFTTRREHGGTGLGLRIARSLIEAQQGTIELVPSTRGATFVLTLPRSPASRAEAPAIAARDATTPVQCSAPRRLRPEAGSNRCTASGGTLEAEAVARGRRARQRHDQGGVSHRAVEQPRGAQLLGEVLGERRARLRRRRRAAGPPGGCRPPRRGRPRPGSAAASKARRPPPISTSPGAVTRPGSRFMAGEPMKVATKRVAGKR